MSIAAGGYCLGQGLLFLDGKFNSNFGDDFLEREGIMLKVFISYSHNDRAIANRIVQLLDKEKFRYWIDTKKHPGDDLDKLIRENLNWCNVLFVIWSVSADKSEWVHHEINFAEKNKKRVIFCKTDNTILPVRFSSIVFINYGDPDFDNKFLYDIKHLPENQETQKKSEIVEPAFVNVRVGDFMPFDIGKTLVTREQYYLMLDENYEPRNDELSKLPVSKITFNEANEFCQSLSSHFDRSYVLPTVEQWIFAANAGNSFEYATEDGKFHERINCDGEKNSPRRMTVVYDGVISKLGIYDMSGNLWEWTQTPHHLADYFIVKGGSWIDKKENCKINAQHAFHRDHANPYTGFRLVRLP